LSDRNELPLEPPVISTWPLSNKVALAPLRAVVIKPLPPAPARVKVPVFSLYSSAVCSASHSKPEIADDPHATSGFWVAVPPPDAANPVVGSV
jgi:hypothetical protein